MVQQQIILTEWQYRDFQLLIGGKLPNNYILAADSKHSMRGFWKHREFMLRARGYE